jgi:hypothetical protein
VIELLGQRGEWYQVGLLAGTDRSRPTGWIHRDLVELMPTQGTGGAPSVPRIPERQPSLDPVAQPQQIRTDTVFHLGATELMVSGGVIGVSADGDTTAVGTFDGLVGFVASPALEIVLRAEILKALGVDAIGSFGGGLLVNVADGGRVIPFVGGLVGRTFGASDLLGGLIDDATWVTVLGGFRVMTPGGGGALIVTPFYERSFNSSDFLFNPDVNLFGVRLGVSVIF